MSSKHLAGLDLLPTFDGGTSLLAEVALQRGSSLEFLLEILEEEPIETFFILTRLDSISGEETTEIVIELSSPS